MEEVQDFLREVARIRRILLRDRLRTGSAWWAAATVCLIGASLWMVGIGVPPARVRWAVGIGALAGMAWLSADLLWSFLRLKRPERLGRLLRRHIPGIRHAVETLSRVDPSLDRFVPGASPGLLAAEARRAANLLRQIRSDWFPLQASRVGPGRVWMVLWVLMALWMARDFWGVSRAVGTLLGLPGGPGGAWWAGPPRAVDVIAYDLGVRIGSGEAASGDLVPWSGDASDVHVPEGGIVEVTGRLFVPVGALEMVIRAREGGQRRISVPLEGDGRFAVQVRPEGDATWYLAAWTPPGEVVQESARRRFRVAPPAAPSLEIRPSGWIAGGLGEAVTVSWWASAPLALGEVEARYRYPWTEEAGSTGVTLRHAREGGREAQGVFPVILGEDLLDRGGRMSLWVEASGMSSSDQPGGRSEELHLYLDVPLVRQLVLLDRTDAAIARLADLFGDVADLPGPGDPALPDRMEGRLRDEVREARSEAVRLATQPAAAALRTTMDRVAGMLEEVMEEVPCRRQRAVRMLESAIASLEDALARERISLLADQVGELDRFAERLSSHRTGRQDREWSFRLRTARWQVGGLEAIRLSFLRRTPTEATGRRMSLAGLGTVHRQFRDALSRGASGDREEVRRTLDAAREVAERWRRLFSEGALTHVRDILLPASVREDLRTAFSLQERVATQTRAVAARVRARMEQREAVPPDRVAEWVARLQAAGTLLRQAEHPRMNPYDLEDLKALERQVRFLADLVEAGDIDRASASGRQVQGLLINLATSIQGDLSDGSAGSDDREVAAYRRALDGLAKAIEEVRTVHRSLREVVSSRRDLLTPEDRGEIPRQVRIQREAARVFGRLSDLLRRIPGIEGAEVVTLSQTIRASMREAVDRLVRQDVTAAEAHQQRALEDLARFRSLLSRRDLDSFRGQEPARFWDDVRLPEETSGGPVVQSWAAEVRRRLDQGLAGPDADLARAYYESLLAP